MRPILPLLLFLSSPLLAQEIPKKEEDPFKIFNISVYKDQKLISTTDIAAHPFIEGTEVTEEKTVAETVNNEIVSSDQTTNTSTKFEGLTSTASVVRDQTIVERCEIKENGEALMHPGVIRDGSVFHLTTLPNHKYYVSGTVRQETTGLSEMFEQGECFVHLPKIEVFSFASTFDVSTLEITINTTQKDYIVVVTPKN